MLRDLLKILPLVGLIVLPPIAARADCAAEVEALRGKVAKPADRVKFGPVRKELDKADEVQPASEIDCRNHLSRAWRAYRAAGQQPPQQAKDLPPTVRME